MSDKAKDIICRVLDLNSNTEVLLVGGQYDLIMASDYGKLKYKLIERIELEPKTYYVLNHQIHYNNPKDGIKQADVAKIAPKKEPETPKVEEPFLETVTEVVNNITAPIITEDTIPVSDNMSADLNTSNNKKNSKTKFFN